MPARRTVLVLLLLARASAALAGGETASLRVRVLDPSGASVPGASVTVEAAGGEQRDTVTDGTGAVTLAGLPLGRAMVQAAIQGFETEARELELRAGSTTLDIRLRLARITEEVAVRAQPRASAGDGYGTVLTEAEIAALPDDPEELEAALRQIAGPNAVLRVNGFTGGRLPPKSQIRQIRMRMNPYSAEFHEAGHVAVDIFTKPGIGEWRTGLRTSLRDSSLNARPPLAPEGAADDYHRYGFTLDGPLWSQRTSLSLAVDGRLTDGERTIYAALPSGTLSELEPVTSDKLEVQARVEHALSPSHTLRLEYQRLGHRQDGLAASGLDLPERAWAQDDVDHIFRLSEMGSIGTRVATETLLELRRSESVFTPRSVAPAVQVLGAFAAGGAQIEGGRDVTGLTLMQHFDWGVKNHALRAGLTVESEWWRSDEHRNADGTFTFPSLVAWTTSRPSAFTRRTGDPRVEFSQTRASVYLQDEIKLGRRAVVSAGLRNEMQTNAGGALNLLPRLGIAYSLDANTTVRLAGGLFRAWYSSDLHAETLRLDGQRLQEQLVDDPGFPDPFAGGEPGAVAPSVLRRAPGLSLPKGLRTSIGLERTMGSVRARVDYSYERWDGLYRSENLNAPAADGERPDPSFANVLQIDSVGRSRKHSAFASASRLQPGSRYGFALTYVFARARSDGDGPTSVPATAGGLDAEWGPALEDVRHRLFGFGRATLGAGFALSAMARYETGAPYPITSGFDPNEDGLFIERPLGLGRNAGRGGARFNVDARLSWTRGFGPERKPSAPRPRVVRIGDGEMPPDMPGGAERKFQASLYLQAFNAANHVNARRYGGVLTSPYFRSIVEADPGRRIELGATLSF